MLRKLKKNIAIPCYVQLLSNYKCVVLDYRCVACKHLIETRFKYSVASKNISNLK